MKLTELVGRHVLYGVDYGSSPINWERAVVQIGKDRAYTPYGLQKYEDAQAISFDLDGVIYTALENPDDGYRSQLETILVECSQVTNRFAGVNVYCVMRNDPDDKILDMYDMESNLPVLSVGTKDASDYYPVFFYDYRPENMAINRAPKEST